MQRSRRTPSICIAALILVACIFPEGARTQVKDTILSENRFVTLSEVVVRSGTDVGGFIDRVRADTTFFKAFRNLRVLSYRSLNDVQIFDRKGKVKASLQSRTLQKAWDGCRVTHTLEQKTKGDYFDRQGEYKYYTARLYDALFFSYDTLCGQHNRVAEAKLSLGGKTGIDKRKEQLKMLFFDPGADIPGIPLMGDKIKIFNPRFTRYYQYDIDIQDWKGRSCYVFSIRARPDLSIFERDKVVIDEMVTWFDYQSFDVMKRNYSMSYDAGVYNFDVRMEVEMSKIDGFLVPTLIRYDGEWGVALKGREKGIFTATIFDVIPQQLH